MAVPAAISLADGYGMHDDIYTEYMRYLGLALNLGVRFVELDVHWIQVARLFGHPPVEWDAETVGCNPSLSSLPTKDQRSFSSAVSEVAAWLLASQGSPSPSPRDDEFLVVYLDDQPDLAQWGHVGELLEQVTAAIPRDLIVSPAELRAITLEQGAPPSIDMLVGRYGKRVLLMSASDYGPAMDHLAHTHHSLCNLSEPLFRSM
ncbi:hypothetical protein GPECTOR_14g136 [Gonium pectorale]|uniref:Uncharacterized protein n=1 Tax=Gonium pectorale TaxID=33097 RepID=A0A150GM62_GONPE|nr:hypothetical protein GPECTOR_14g136 [Gonium pectorale]|eukprot:KXZ50887.1 hypothetical protein GPECTOR_14g136 [Gonium pectorale]